MSPIWRWLDHTRRICIEKRDSWHTGATSQYLAQTWSWSEEDYEPWAGVSNSIRGHYICVYINMFKPACLPKCSRGNTKHSWSCWTFFLCTVWLKITPAAWVSGESGAQRNVTLTCCLISPCFSAPSYHLLPEHYRVWPLAALFHRGQAKHLKRSVNSRLVREICLLLIRPHHPPVGPNFNQQRAAAYYYFIARLVIRGIYCSVNFRGP